MAEVDITSDEISEVDSKYFNSYDDLSVHELMLKDAARVEAFKSFIESNLDQFMDKVVVDVGSGTGILSLLAARAGAKHVYAIEAASEVATLSKDIIERNGYADRITVINSPVERVVLSDNEKADVIISEWMGFYLFHESMLGAVIAARDRLLKPDGVIFPSSGTLYVCPVALKKYVHERFDFWQDLYGFDFSVMASVMRRRSLAKPEVFSVPEQSLIAQPQQVISIDMKFVELNDVNDIMATTDFVIQRNDVLHGFALWFDVSFEGSRPVVLSTSPSSAMTHWHQTVALLPDALLVNRSSLMSCRVMLHRRDRRYDISIQLLDDESSDGDEESGSEGMTANCDISDPSTEVLDLISQRMKPVL